MVYLALFYSFFKIGFFSFGGGYAMIPLIEKEIVNIHKWIPVNEFLDIIAISQLTPGPIAINAATFVGHKISGVLGSIAATVGVTAPSFIIILIIAMLIKKVPQPPNCGSVFSRGQACSNSSHNQGSIFGCTRFIFNGEGFLCGFDSIFEFVRIKV